MRGIKKNLAKESGHHEVNSGKLYRFLSKGITYI